MKGKTRIIRVTSTTDYQLIEYPDGSTNINGWSVDGVIDSWFHGQYPLYQSHATRTAHQVGYSEKVVTVDVLDDVPYKLFGLAVRD